MRVVVFLILVSSTLGVVSYLYPEIVQKLGIEEQYSNLKQYLNTKLTEREVKITGLNLLKEDRIRKLLPADKNNIEWRIQSSKLLKPLYDLPLVQQASLTACQFYSLQCFEINIKEKTPKFIATLKDTLWLVNDEGGFMLSLGSRSDALRVKKVREQLKLPMVYGLELGDPVPMVVQSRALYIKRALNKIDQHINSAVNSVEFVNDGELVIWLKEYPFQIQVSSSFKDTSIIDTELARLKKVLHEVTPYRNAIQRIDLAYNKVAVLKLTDSAVQARANLKLQKEKEEKNKVK